jgi:large subunit ribosomal protein L4
MSADEEKPARKPAKSEKAEKKPAKPKSAKAAAARPASKSAAKSKARAESASAAKAAKAEKAAAAPKTRKAAGPRAAPGELGQVPHWNGRTASQSSVDASTLGSIVKLRLLRSVVRAYEANQRQGTASTKTRGETNRTERKPYKQKGTGNARRGDFNSPLLRGGGVTFGPRPRDYRQSLPRRALREALRSALLGKLRDGEVVSLDGGGFKEPSTKQAATALRELGCQRSAVVVLPALNPPVWKSFRNIPRVSVVPASDLNAHHVLAHDKLVLVDDAWTRLLARLPQRREEAAAAAGAGGEA